MKFVTKLRTVVAVGLAAGLLGALAPGASAQGTQTSVYHPTEGARTFSGGLNGWVGSKTKSGLCLPFLTCPSITNTHQPNGGNPDGYIRTRMGGALADVAASVSGIWESPSFSYQGAQGHVPTSLSFAMDRRAAVTNLLNVAGSSASFSVEVVNAGNGSIVQVVPGSTLAGAANWTSIPPVLLDPSKLVIGQSYFFRITSRFGFDPVVIPSARAEYDNVALTATFVPGPQIPHIPENRLLTDRFLTDFIKNNTRNWIGIKGNKALVMTRCPGRAVQQAPNCQFDVTVLKHRRGPAATNTLSFALAAGHKKFLTFGIKPQFRNAEFKTRAQILTRFHVVIGNINIVVYKQLRPVDCARRPVC
jgi:hypothetical protein